MEINKSTCKSCKNMCANVLAQTSAKSNLPGTQTFSSLNYKVDQQADFLENSAYLLRKETNRRKKNKNKKSICRHVFSCPATPTAFSASRGFCAPEACVSACVCCSARKGLAVMAPWPWLWAPGSRLLMGS